MRPILTICALLALAGCSQPAATPAANTVSAPAPTPAKPVATTAPAGAYTLDKNHASLVFRLDHMGFSHYTARFTGFDARLQLDPANPAAAHLEATVDPRSLTLDNPPPGFADMLRGPQWLDAAKYPQMTFRSTAVELTGPATARITGDFTFHGVTRPVVLEATFNGGYPGMSMDPHARIGFSAHGVLKRSEFGMGAGIPPPGSKMGVGDEVSIMIETEFSGPAYVAPPPK